MGIVKKEGSLKCIRRRKRRNRKKIDEKAWKRLEEMIKKGRQFGSGLRRGKKVDKEMEEEEEKRKEDIEMKEQQEGNESKEMTLS